MSTLTRLRRAATSPFDIGLSWLSIRCPDIRIEERLDGDQYVLRAEIPGVDPGRDVRLDVVEGDLRIRVKRAQTRTDNGRSEFRYGSFARTVALPAGVQADTITALYADGVLEISALVTAQVPVAKTIPVTVSAGERS